MLYFVCSALMLLLIVGLVYYWWAQALVERNIVESTALTLAQMNRNIITMLSGVQDITLFLIANHNVQRYFKAEADSEDDAQVILAHTMLNDDLANLITSKNYILAINIYGNNHLNYESAGPSTTSRQGIDPQLPSSGELVRSGVYARRFLSLGEKQVLSFYRMLRDPNQLTRNLGVVRIDVDHNAIASMLAEHTPESKGFSFICDDKGTILFHPDFSRIGSIGFEDFATLQKHFTDEGYAKMRFNDTDSLLTSYRSSLGTLINVRPFAEILEGLRHIRTFIIILFIITGSVAALSAWLIAHSITEPLYALMRSMRKIENGELGAQVIITGDDEVSQLGITFNSMSANIRRLIDEVYKIEIEKKEAEFKMLQAQINPHFLYNTLDIIYWTARMENAVKTAQVAYALSRFFRLSLNRGQEMTTLKHELEHLNCYVTIQNFRFDDPPEITINVEAGIEDCVTTKLLLQPLVENAFIHGIASIDYKGHIHIDAAMTRDDTNDTPCITIRVEDNGVGMDEEHCRHILKENMSERQGYGVWNVDRSIKLFFGKSYGLHIESTPGKGTVVIVHIPYMKAEASEKV
ncbi:MAG: sensor histidine kinase [Treponema sp.]|nr:sensor histidine kinase [Treponema sp.]